MELNAMNLDPSTYNAIEVSDNDFAEVQQNLKMPVKYDANNVITYEANDPIQIVNEDNFITNIDFIVNRLNQVIDKGYDANLNSQWIIYRDAVNALDPRDQNTYVYPINKTVEQIVEETGVTIFNTLQLP